MKGLSHHEVRTVGHGPSSAEGKLIVSGPEYKGVFDRDTGACVFAPPCAVELRLGGKEVLAWRCELRPGATGVGRGDYDWTIECYRWPELTLAWSHAVQSRDIIEWCWVNGFGQLEEAKQVIVLRCGYEGGEERLFLIRLPDDIVETDDRSRALELAGVARPTRPERPPAVPVTEPLLQAILDDPESDAARLAYADALSADGDPRGELIRIQVKGARAKLTRQEKQREKGLLAEHGRAWSAAMSIIKTGQRWERGFLVAGLVGGEVAKDFAVQPEWRLFREIPGNMLMPDANLMDCLESLRGFNLSGWLAERRAPWGRLRTLLAREKELALLAPERFPALERLVIFSCLNVDLRATLAFPGLKAVELIGREKEHHGMELAELLAVAGDSPVGELVYSPYQGTLGYRAVFTRGSDGRLSALAFHCKKPHAESMLRDLLKGLPPASVQSVARVPARKEGTP